MLALPIASVALIQVSAEPTTLRTARFRRRFDVSL
jgi:hypothetical protein